jgi:hypothetical protein
VSTLAQTFRAAALLVNLGAVCAGCARAEPLREEPREAPPPRKQSPEPKARRLALDCRQTDGTDTTFHRQFLLGLDEHRAWGDQSVNGIYEIEISAWSGSSVRGDSRAVCPPNDPDSCRVRRVVSYELDLERRQMVQTLWNDTGRHGRADGVVVEVLHFECAELPLEASTIAPQLGS